MAKRSLRWLLSCRYSDDGGVGGQGTLASSSVSSSSREGKMCLISVDAARGGSQDGDDNDVYRYLLEPKICRTKIVSMLPPSKF